jgi:hypothetical protein
MHSHGGGVGRDGEDDDTHGNDNEVVDLGDDAPYVIPCTQMKKGNASFGKGKGIVVIDSQSGGEEDDHISRGALMEEYEKRRPQQLQGEEERGKRSKGTTQGGRRRPQNSSIRDNDIHTISTPKYNRHESEEDDYDTETLSLPRRSDKKNVDEDGGEGEGTTRKMLMKMVGREKERHSENHIAVATETCHMHLDRLAPLCASVFLQPHKHTGERKF